MNRLQFWFEKSGVKPVELAGILAKSENTVKSYIAGTTEPLLSDAMKISDFTGIPVTTLYEEVDTEGNPIEQLVTA